jgi:integrator complex subunit 11
VQVDDELEIKAYYAGHVLGAAMFHIRVGPQSVVYTVSYLAMYSLDNGRM